MINNLKARVIAYYLPQFHPIPENDLWWGKGFTEWTNVGKAKPLFKGHYQPRVPADLGYYDLRMPEIREAQAEMARNAGIEGFMYWHYWFGNGKEFWKGHLMKFFNQENLIFHFVWVGPTIHGQIIMEFCITVEKGKIYHSQTYPGEKDYIEHFYTVLPAFQDKRYIKVNNEPLFFVYDPVSIPDPKRFMDIWKELAVKNGLSGIHFIGLAGGWIENFQKYLI
jgi:hypothetical protein